MKKFTKIFLIIMFLITLVTFSACNKQVNVDEEKDVYDLDNYIIVGRQDGVWFEGFKDKSAVKHAIVPNGVTHISLYAFYECPNLMSVVFPNSINELLFSFYKCENLYWVEIPASVDTLSFGWYDSSPNFTDIYFTGTKDQWSQLKIKGMRPNNQLNENNRFNIYCSDGQLYFKQD